MEDIVPPKKVRFNYKKADDYRILYANGAYGGFTPRKELMFHFFHEYKKTLETEVMAIGEDGSTIPLKKDIPEELEMIRELKVGIVLTIEEAFNIGRWMLDKVEEFRKATEVKSSEIEID
jgi:hypothetical protein